MKRIIFLVIFLLIINTALATDFFENQEAVIDLTISSELTIVPTSSSYSVKSLKAELSMFPLSDSIQTPLSMTTTPTAEKTSSAYIFEWKNPETRVLPYKLTSQVKTKNLVNKVTKKIPFPVKSITPEINEYTKSTEYMNSDDPVIIKQASSLAAGEDDLYVVIYNLAEWIKENIQYSLESSTEDVSQKATWVLQNKKGVCDEITTLFIAFCRSLGIPAKYISGVAYTNYNDLNDFGPHAWAEVYIDGKWIPFDITYDQMGYIDSSHIKLDEDYDASTSSVKYSWTGLNAELESSGLEIKAEAKSLTGNLEKLLRIKSNAIKSFTGFNSYNLIETIVENPNGFYVATHIMVSQTEGLEINEKAKDLLLKPYETKKVYWIIKTTTLDSNFVYTFPIVIYSVRNESSETEFTVSKNEPVYTQEEITALLNELKEEETKTLSNELSLGCKTEKSDYYIYEKPVIRCTAKNMGNVMLEEISACLDKECSKFDLGISQQKEISFNPVLSQRGTKDFRITAQNSQVSQIARIPINIMDEPSVSIESIIHPESVNYEDSYQSKFTLKKNSGSVPKIILVRFSHGNFAKEWEMDVLNTDQNFVMDMTGADLNVGENTFTIEVSFKDDNSKEYSTSESFKITLNTPTAIQRVKIFFNSIGRWFAGIFQ